MYKGILLAGGAGTRLYPLTSIISKQLLPVYDKPMIYYPLSTLMLFGIKDVLIISTANDTPNIQNLLCDGSQLGMKFSYEIQEYPNGIAEALILGKNFIGDDDICLILGDNVFYMGDQIGHFSEVITDNHGAVICTYHVPDPHRFGVATIRDDDDIVLSLEEKPKNPKSNLAVTGLYFYKNDAIQKASQLKPSARGELEITDLNLEYLREGHLKAIRMVRGTTWMDAGTPDSLIDAALFVQMIEKRQGLKISCIEEIALNRDFISIQQFEKLVLSYKGHGNYKMYLEGILHERKRYA